MKKKKLTAIKQGGSQPRGQCSINQKHNRVAHPPRPQYTPLLANGPLPRQPGPRASPRFDLLDILPSFTRGGAAGPRARASAALPRAGGLKAVGLKSRTAVRRGQKGSFNFFAFSTALLFLLLLSRVAVGAHRGNSTDLSLANRADATHPTFTYAASSTFCALSIRNFRRVDQPGVSSLAASRSLRFGRKKIANARGMYHAR